MIRLTKTIEPPVLATNKVRWTSEYTTYTDRGDRVPDAIAGRYRHTDIKNQLVIETRGKCAYCESKLLHIAFGDIEHILPKATNTNLVFDWDNLTLSCPRCNNNKGDYDAATHPLVNPYRENPSDHLRGFGAFVWALAGNTRADTTVKTLKLNRDELVDMRKDRIESLMPLIELWTMEQNPVRKEVLRNQIVEESKEDKEFSFVVRQFLEDSQVI